ncbi:coniferyl aldehyde dehydrogenase [Vibrio algicola]|uniref:Aldehyde dehydrogenase n=1 Tax=Vibrio algicola TaxID=2662262 RepID=A0A5Q0THP1_9VIBR|nr:coniferyl aldehyde dehydrogenase [Vibrio algicola]
MNGITSVNAKEVASSDVLSAQSKVIEPAFVASSSSDLDLSDSLSALLQKMQESFTKHPSPSLDERKQKLLKLKQSLITHQKSLVQALSEDFGYRSEFDSTMADIMPTVAQINYTLKRLNKWAKPSRRHAGLMFAPSKVSVQYQPLGVVGIISPWNFPVILSLAPLVTALAAGNKVMMKLSEFTPKTNQVIRTIVAVISKDVEVVEGEAQVAQAFSQLRFDHLLFTGSTSVGHAVAKVAAQNLTPVTLELGGKSPVIVADDVCATDAGLIKAIDAILFGKCLNAGQICVSPDYAFVPQAKVDKFVQLFLARFEKHYPAGKKGRDFTHIINQRQYERLQSYLRDAQEKGGCIHAVKTETKAEANTKLSKPSSERDVTRRLLPHLITDVNDDMLIMQQEIFGPILPIKPYKYLHEAIDYINHGERPLALYLMSNDKNTTKTVLRNTHSGGVGINDTVLHVGAEDAPFGGIGESGIGHYHGVEGFKTFSHAKTVFNTPTWLPRISFLMKHKKFAVRTFKRWFIR